MKESLKYNWLCPNCFTIPYINISAFYPHTFFIRKCLCVRHWFQTHNICTANTMHYHNTLWYLFLHKQRLFITLSIDLCHSQNNSRVKVHFLNNNLFCVAFIFYFFRKGLPLTNDKSSLWWMTKFKALGPAFLRILPRQLQFISEKQFQEPKLIHTTIDSLHKNANDVWLKTGSMCGWFEHWVG